MALAKYSTFTTYVLSCPDHPDFALTTRIKLLADLHIKDHNDAYHSTEPETSE